MFVFAFILLLYCVCMCGSAFACREMCLCARCHADPALSQSQPEAPAPVETPHEEPVDPGFDSDLDNRYPVEDLGDEDEEEDDDDEEDDHEEEDDKVIFLFQPVQHAVLCYTPYTSVP